MARGQRSGEIEQLGAEKSFPRCGKVFSMVWKIFDGMGGGGAIFSTVWKLFFHSVEKLKIIFPWRGKRAVGYGGRRGERR
jgi:hypothetical protein